LGEQTDLHIAGGVGYFRTVVTTICSGSQSHEFLGMLIIADVTSQTSWDMTIRDVGRIVSTATIVEPPKASSQAPTSNYRPSSGTSSVEFVDWGYGNRILSATRGYMGLPNR
jgi:hypothetical protein